MSKYFLGIDIGTYSSKGVICDEHGSVAAQQSISHNIEIPHPGWAEQDADKIWWGEFCRLCRGLIDEAHINPQDILCVSHSGMSPCLLPCDDLGKPLYKGILYGIDARAYVEQQELTSQFTETAIIDLSGTALSSQAVTPKICWFKKHFPELAQKTRYYFSLQGYLSFKLTSRYVLDIYDAVGYPILFNQKEHVWDLNNAAVLGISKEQLPELVWANQLIGTVTKTAAKECGLCPGTPVLPGCADAATEALCAGVKDNGDLMIMYASSTFFIVKTDRLLPSRIFWPSWFLEPGTCVLTGGTATCGSLITWFLNTFCQKEIDEAKAAGQNPFAYMLSKIPAAYDKSQNQILCLPYFSGERTPINDNLAQGVFFGLNLQSSLADLYLAMLEGIAFSISHNVQEINKLQTVKRIMSIGGGALNRRLLQAVSDVCNLKQFGSNQKIGAAYGDCLLAAAALGKFTNTQEAVNAWIKSEVQVQPDASLRAHYQQKFSRYRKLYPALAELMHES